MQQTQRLEISDLRRKLAPAMRRTEAALAVRTTAELTHRALADLVACSTTTDPLPLFDQVVGQATAQFFFGPNSQHFAQATDGLFTALAHTIGNPWAGPSWVPTRARREINARHRDLQNQITAHLRTTATSQPPRGAADSFWTKCRADLGPKARRDVVADALIGSMLASYRIPAAQASSVLLVLADNPGLQAELRGEATAFGSSLATSTRPMDARQYPLTMQVVLEALRLYPSTWLIRRTCARTTTIGTYTVPAGHQLWISPYVIGRDPTLYDEPEAFRPERWNSNRRTPALLSFGHGTRRCPGNHLALGLLVATTLSALGLGTVYRDSTPITVDARINLVPRGLAIGLETSTQVAKSGPSPTP
ncbi:cytochrome P450 [Marmoricola sp. RAF53]|uniref:cytochrome P450 n=1 Tax=Marmoricola sp. RAF53 TaxID=3233059 RepID=UPI003F9BE0F2